jgi:site-specific recombinase XerD
MTRRTRAAVKPAATARPVGWTETLDRFCMHLQEREKSPATVRGYRYDLNLFARWYAIANDGEQPELATIDAADLRAWKAWMDEDRKMLPQSINRPLAAVQALLDWGQDHDWCQAVPLPRTMAQETQPPRWLSTKEENALVRAVDAAGVPRDIALVKLLLYAGLRISEAAALRWNQIDARERTGEVTVVGKGRKRRTIPLEKEARRALMTLADRDGPSRLGTDAPVFEGRQGGLTAKTLWRIVGRYGHAAKLYDDLVPHVLRHTYCHNLAMKGGRLESIAALAGHESIETTRRYVEPGKDDLQELVEKLTADAGSPPPADRPPRRSRRR